MMTSSNGNIFRVTGHLCGEFTGPICVWIIGWVNSREAGDLRRYRAHYEAIVMYSHEEVASSYLSNIHLLEEEGVGWRFGMGVGFNKSFSHVPLSPKFFKIIKSTGCLLNIIFIFSRFTAMTQVRYEDDSTGTKPVIRSFTVWTRFLR